MSKPLDLADQQRFMDVLMRIDSMRAGSSRDALILMVEQELGLKLSISRHEKDSFDVWRIVDGCLTYPGGLHALVSVLEMFHRGSSQVTELRLLLDELLPEPLLSTKERRELWQLAQAVEEGDLQLARSPAASAALARLCKEAVGPVGPWPDRVVRSLSVLMAHLEEVPVRPDGFPPLLVFVARLAQELTGPVSEALADWARRFAQHRDLEMTALPQLSRPAVHTRELGPAPEPAQQSAYLVIEFQPDRSGSGLFLLSAWLQADDELGTMVHCDDDPVPFADLHLLMARLLTEDPNIVNRRIPTLTVEFVLPRALLNEPLDQLKITIEGLERRLGIDHPVVVRSLDRIRRRAMHHNWRRKWAQLYNEPGSATMYRLHEPGQYGDEQLYAMLSDDSVCCVTLAFPPSLDTAEMVDELWVAIQSGAPIIAWTRAPRDPKRFSTEFHELFAAGPLSLPWNVQELRRRAAAQESDTDHLGNDLSLIFDNADRVPEPYLRLNTPA